MVTARAVYTDQSDSFAHRPLFHAAFSTEKIIKLFTVFVFKMIPKRFFLTRGAGKHRESWQSFELALRNAGIQHCNMVNARARDGTNVVPLTTGDIPGHLHGGYGVPEWSRDGSKILHHKRTETTVDLFVVSATNYTDFVHLGPGANAHWAFNDTKIVFDMSYEQPGGLLDYEPRWNKPHADSEHGLDLTFRFFMCKPYRGVREEQS